MEIFIATDLLNIEGEFRFNAVYAFKSKTSVKSYEKYLKSTGENHKLIVTPAAVSDLDHSLEVVTVFDISNDSTEYKSTTVLDDYDEARDLVANIKESPSSVEVHRDSVKIHSRFSPDILHCGWAEL